MKTSNIVLLSILAFLIIVVMWGVSTNNSLVQLREDTNIKSSQIQTTLQRRIDLIPNLVETVKGYASHESAVFTEIAEARSKLSGAISTGEMDKIKQANDGLSASLGRLLAIQENYPNLKADVHFTALMDSLEGTENRINVARQQYNDSVGVYNKRLQVFPASVIAGMGGFIQKPYFEADEGAKKVPNVKF